MAYLIIRRVSARCGGPNYVAWTPADMPISGPFEKLLTTGDMLEILEYVPDSSIKQGASVPVYGVTQVYQWCEHFDEQEGASS